MSTNFINFQDRLNDIPNWRKLHGESNATTFGTTRGHTRSTSNIFMIGQWPTKMTEIGTVHQYIRTKLARRASTLEQTGPEGRVHQDETGMTGQYDRTKLARRFRVSSLDLRFPHVLALLTSGLNWPSILQYDRTKLAQYDRTKLARRASTLKGQFGPDVLALRASLVLSYWAFGPV